VHSIGFCYARKKVLR